MQSTILITFLNVLVLCHISVAQESNDLSNNKRIINEINQGQKTNQFVSINGVVEQYGSEPSNNTISYVLQDDWGDRIAIISSLDYPEIDERYIVKGVVNEYVKDFYVLIENERQNLASNQEAGAATEKGASINVEELDPNLSFTQPTVGGLFNIYIILLILLITIISAILVVVLLMNRKKVNYASQIDNIEFTHDQTIKAPAPTQEAITGGTVKTLPGRFKVLEGSSINEIRLIRPFGAADHELKYTFGRNPGDSVKHIQIADQTVSSRQAELIYRNVKYTLINIPDPNDPDRNATVINDRKMAMNENHHISQGDKIQMGHVVIEYHNK